ncbi:polymer-forming cytoskeletal protein [Treponema sp. OttesenSCG-928-L16]|nr:polymer-forming cytoskeletal protein [Treponema sp. OttesenSCG-928-L16]
MPRSSVREDFSINTIIGPNTMVQGDIDSAGFTRIDGSLRGSLKAKGKLVVGEKSRIKGDLSGTFLTIGGVVRGNVLASERIIILASGVVMGDIITRRIQADEGCLIHGRVTVCQSEDAWRRAVAEYKDAQGVRHTLSAIAMAGEHSNG